MKTVAHKVQLINEKQLAESIYDLKSFVRQAAVNGLSAHEAETGIWKRMLKIGHGVMGTFLSSLGTGDLGEIITISEGNSLVRFKKLSTRPYMTVFGEFRLQRAVYGRREKQRIEHVPLDSRLKLPESKFSYLLQDWDQSFAVDNSFESTNQTIGRILGINQSVDSLERMNYKMSLDVEDFRDQKAVPSASEEGQICVISADGKGIPMRRGEEDIPIERHRKKGIKSNKKRMAIVGTAYTIDPLIRTPEDVVASLFSAKNYHKGKSRPHALNKNVYASLTYEMDGRIYEASDVVFARLRDELNMRNASISRPVVLIMDGQESLWNKGSEYIPRVTVEILDLLHVTPRLWQAAHLFHGEGTGKALYFVKERLLKVLRGEAMNVVRGLRRMGTMRKFSGRKMDSLVKICNYFEKNKNRLRYDLYLSRGFPIASGVIEGACRYYIKDRMEKAGMRWCVNGAQAMLDVRSTYLNDDWDDYMEFRRVRENRRLHANAAIDNGIEWPLVC